MLSCIFAPAEESADARHHHPPQPLRPAQPRHRRNERHPFIDVLLVLLIMLILAMPVQVNVTPVDLPSDRAKPVLPVLEQNTIAIDPADRLSWNGAPLSAAELRAQVAAATALDQQPLLRFEPDALASYDTAARTIALIKEEGAEGFAFIGNERHRNFN